MNEIDQEPLIEAAAGEISISTDNNDDNTNEVKASIFSVSDLSSGMHGQVNLKDVADILNPSNPLPASNESSRLGDNRIDLGSIPDSLKKRRQWVLWKLEQREAKLTKVPYQTNGSKARSNDPTTWSDFLTCQKTFEAGGFSGIGFAFSNGDGLCGVDLDHCLDAAGQPEQWAQEIIEQFADSYIEVSPSGDGLHIWCLGRPIKTGHKKWKVAKTGSEQGIEVYDFNSPRYLTVTGNALQKQEITDGQIGLDWLYQEYFVQQYDEPNQVRDSSGEPDVALVTKALDHVDADDYATWIQIGMALKAGGLNFDVWDHWSSKSAKYAAGECAHKWSTFNGTSIGLGTVFYIAKESGFNLAAAGTRKDVRGQMDSTILTHLPAWPTLSEEALHGLAGEIVRAATKDSEADPAAVLITVLVRAGATIGAQCYFNIGETKHPPRLMAAIVGASSRARKGTSTHPVSRIFEEAEAIGQLPKLQVSNGPLSTGEGLVYAVRDASEKLDKDGNPEDPGVTDKRLLVIEGELGAPLRAMQREGNTLSALIRTAWDSGNIAPLTKSNRIKASGAHISILGHITRQELGGLLQSREVWNGFANRFIWVCARRSGVVPFPQPMDETVVNHIASNLGDAMRVGRQRTCLNFHPDTAAIWKTHYPQLSSDAPGIFGTITARAEAQVMRLSMIYALLDQSDMIAPVHLQAAMSVWEYCRQSARCIFGSEEVDPDVNRLIQALREDEKTQTEINRLFSGHSKSAKLNSILGDLQAAGIVTQRTEGGGKGKGKAPTIWSLRPGFVHGSAEFDELEE